MTVDAIPSIKVNSILKAYQNFDASKEHLHAPIHALDRVYAQLRESVPAVNETLHPQIKGALVVDIHEARVIPPRSGSEKRVRDSSVGSSEAAKKKGKAGNQSQPNTQKTSQSRGRSASRGRSGTSRPGGSGGGGKTKDQGKRSDPSSGYDRTPPQSSSGTGSRGRSSRSRVGQSRFLRKGL